MSIVAGEVRDFEADTQKVSTARSAALRPDDGGLRGVFRTNLWEMNNSMSPLHTAALVPGRLLSLLPGRTMNWV